MSDIEDIYDQISKKRGYENYPASVVLITSLLFYGGYAAQAIIFYQYNPLWGFLSALFSLGVEYYVMKWACVKCYYYGKWCARAGKGMLVALLFDKADPMKGKLLSYKERERCRINAWGNRKFDLKVMAMFFLPPLLAQLMGLYRIIMVEFSVVTIFMVLFLFVSGLTQGKLHEEFMCKMCKNRDFCPGLKALKGEK